MFGPGKKTLLLLGVAKPVLASSVQLVQFRSRGGGPFGVGARRLAGIAFVAEPSFCAAAAPLRFINTLRLIIIKRWPLVRLTSSSGAASSVRRRFFFSPAHERHCQCNRFVPGSSGGGGELSTGLVGDCGLALTGAAAGAGCAAGTCEGAAGSSFPSAASS